MVRSKNKVWVFDSMRRPLLRHIRNDEDFEELVELYKARVQAMYDGKCLVLEVKGIGELYRATYDGEWVELMNSLLRRKK